MTTSNGTPRNRFPRPLAVRWLALPPRGSIGAAGLSELASSLGFALAVIGMPGLFRSPQTSDFDAGLPLCVYIGSVTMGVACFYQSSSSWKSWSEQVALDLGRALGFTEALRLTRIGHRLSVLALLAVLILSLRLNPFIPTDENGSGALAVIRIPLLVNIMFFFSCFAVVLKGAADWIDTRVR
jgi:hypothetical protein